MSSVLTDIKSTKKGRYALFCDGEFLFSVDEETLVRHELKPGMELTPQEIGYLSEESDLHAAREKAYLYLSMRDHSEKELYDKLKKNFDPHTCAAVVARLRELGLADDTSFAGKAVSSLRRKGKSTAEIRRKLQEKGISREILEGMEELKESDESEEVRAIIEKQYLRKLAEPGGDRKVYAALARKGFRSADIRKALTGFGTQEDTYYE